MKGGVPGSKVLGVFLSELTPVLNLRHWFKNKIFVYFGIASKIEIVQS